ncbi:DNA-methyltransferase [Rubinisphaera italica]|uniref:DNA adenine methyltransferase YhdJ n=1 Tax=Rubinisphaera italica TaxID=2527969 RepID=A0A5C5XKX4_9PLAN|nr:site-specific DNA-methyltransferase [Rubinisphaera italica]TWT62795.1 DNA adenine methyltransferase YhdJ [Rubinisphaera italica]
MLDTEFKLYNRISHEDCVAGLNGLEPNSVDLVFADPPFNIGYEYDEYDDRLERDQYLEWSTNWMQAVYNALKKDGTFWLAIGDEYAAELKLAAQEIGFHPRSWVIWYYTFGVNCKNKYSRSHAHLFYLVKDPKQFTFLGEDLENRIPSARQLVYNDKRANPKGRLPDDTWIISPSDAVGDLHADDQQTWTLRPQDLESRFQSDEDTWYFPRVAGTFKERAGFHGCQMPEQLLGRIIRNCSRENELVVDPFAGSGTTLAVAKKLGRKYLGFELSEDYVKASRERLKKISVGDQLDGSAEPTMSAPGTWAKKSARAQNRTNIHQEEAAAETPLRLTLAGLKEAFLAAHQGYSVDRLLLDPDLNAAFHESCRQAGLFGDPQTWNLLLLRLRRDGELQEVPCPRRTDMSWPEIDTILSGCEISLQTLLVETQTNHLTEIMSDPELLQRFNDRARLLSPGATTFKYRWAAVMLSRQTGIAHKRASILAAAYDDSIERRLSAPEKLDDSLISKLPECSGLFLIAADEPLYCGETLNLKLRVESLDRKALAVLVGVAENNLSIRVMPQTPELFGELAWQNYLASRFQTKWNLNN